jgi:integrase
MTKKKRNRQIKFTALGLSRLHPEKARAFYTEAGTSADRRGLVLVVEPTGRKRFVARLHLPGDMADGRRSFTERVVTLGSFGNAPGEIDIEEAHRRFAKVREDVQHGKQPTPFVQRAAAPAARRQKRRQRREPSPLFDRTPAGAIPNPPTGAHSIELLAYEFYWHFLVPERKRPEYAARILEADVLREWRGRDARTITPREVVMFLRKKAEASPVMSNRVAALTSQMFRFGIEVGIVEDTPYKLLRKPGGREKPRQRVLSDDELQVFWSMLPTDKMKMSESVRCALRILLLTGARRGEIAAARWEHVTKGVWMIPATTSKTGHPHDFPITAPVQAEFEKLRVIAKDSEFVMPSPVAGLSLDPHAITTAMRRSVTAFDIGQFTVHDLRRTMRTGLSALGVSSETAERTIGHLVGSDIQRTYDVHQFETERRSALEKWAAHVAAVMVKKPVLTGAPLA